jgi:LmbE family N-acetylglucosaminyl deacetylase
MAVDRQRVLMPPTLLFSFAHPDDESFSGAGLACWCLAQGIPVVLVCATRGDRGKAGEAAISGAPRDVAAAREQELREAARIIGIQEVHQLGYRDRELADADPADIRRALVQLIRRYRPAVVVTFDPDGYNRHPDHVAISRFTSDAIAAAADPRWFSDIAGPHTVQRLLWTPPLAPWEAARAEDVAAEPGADFILDISRWSAIKARALRAHRTQHASVEKYFFNQPDVDRVLALEVYRHAWGPPLEGRPSSDIFAGVI